MYSSIQTIQIGINVTKYVQDFSAKNYKIDESNQRPKLGVRWCVFLSWETQYCQNVVFFSPNSCVDCMEL